MGLLSNHITGLLLKPLEALAFLVVLTGVIVGVGISASWWTADQAMAVITPLLGNIAVVLIKFAGPAADLVLVTALVTALHNWRRAFEVGAAAIVVALVSAHFGGQDWMASLPALIHHPTTVTTVVQGA